MHFVFTFHATADTGPWILEYLFLGSFFLVMTDHLLSPLSGSLLGLHRLQTVGNQTVDCVPGAEDTSLENCNKLDEILARCNTLANKHAPKQDIIDCFCIQEVLSGYVGYATILYPPSLLVYFPKTSLAASMAY